MEIKQKVDKKNKNQTFVLLYILNCITTCMWCFVEEFTYGKTKLSRD
jgi:hypothetical protein